MKQIHMLGLLLVLVFCASCGGQNKPVISKDDRMPATNNPPASRWMDTHYEYTDSTGKRLVIENSLPKGERYTDPAGKEYARAIFWTRIINETSDPLELAMQFPVDSYEPPWSPGKYYQVLLPPDTMTTDKEPLYNYGMTDLKSFLDKNMRKPSSLKRTIHAKESGGFYVVIVCRIADAAPGALRTGLSLKGQDLFYRISLVKGPSTSTVDKEIHGGSINLKNLVLRK